MSALKLEVGKSYRTRGGRKVERLSRNEGINRGYFPFVGYIKGNGLRYTFQENGMYLESGNSKNDIIAEWVDAPVTNTESVLQEAERLINGDRAEAYGDAKTMFDNIAIGWSVIFGKEVTGKQVALGMAWLKICRENNKGKRDNIVDIAGYAALIEKL